MIGNRKRQLTICLFLILLSLFFIWGNSALPASESAELSNGVLDWLKDLVGEDLLGKKFPIRKIAHFTEFACLGALLTWLFQCLNQKWLHGFTMPLLCGGLAALMDETIQTGTPGRGPSVIDVWIDISGVIAGTALLLWIWWKRSDRQNKVSNGGNKT